MSDARKLIEEVRRYIEEDAPDEDHGTDLLAQVTDALEAEIRYSHAVEVSFKDIGRRIGAIHREVVGSGLRDPGLTARPERADVEARTLDG